MLEGITVELDTLASFPDLPQAVEEAMTFEENARRKAVHYSTLTGLITLADDSGLEVDVLSGEPGVHSARYAGADGDEAANNAKLVRKLRGVPMERRTARFRCVVALAYGKDVIAVAHGAIEGVIVDEARGRNGFGYDPHFLVPEFGVTTAEMPREQKNRISHRGRALLAIRPAIERVFNEGSVAGAEE